MSELIYNIFMILVFVSPSLWIYWELYKDTLITDYSKSEIAGVLLASSIPLANWIFMIMYMYQLDNNEDSIKNYMKKLNKVRNCNTCDISSRIYQMKNNMNSDLECPHCNTKNSSGVFPDGEYPFAPKLNRIKALKFIKKEHKMKNVKENFKKLEKYDNELVAYEKLQLKKLQEFEQKANEIKAELKII